MIVQEIAAGQIEVSAVDPVASMMGVDNPALGGLADEVRAKLRHVVDTA